MSSGPIQTAPLGLLGLLNLKNLGRNPKSMEDDVQPVMDITSLYLQGQVEDLPDMTLARTALAGGGFSQWATPVLVPAGEAWYVHNYTVFCTMVAGDTVTGMAPLVRVAQATTSQFAMFGDKASSRVGQGSLMSGCGGFWLVSGAELGFFAEAVLTAGSVSFIGWAHITRVAT